MSTLFFSRYSLGVRGFGGTSEITRRVGSIYTEKDCFDSAVKYCIACMKVACKIGDQLTIANTWFKLGRLFMKQLLQNEAAISVMKAKQLYEHLDKKISVELGERGLKFLEETFDGTFDDSMVGIIISAIEQNKQFITDELLKLKDLPLWSSMGGLDMQFGLFIRQKLLD